MIGDAGERAASHVREARLWDRHMELAAFGATAAGGVDRPALSAAEAAARGRLLEWAAARGMTAHTDGVGNLFLRLEGRDPALPPLLTGSHLDSQPTGGRFDGVSGVLAGFEAVEALLDAGIAPRRSIEVVAWMNEEGNRFAPGMMGSEVFAGWRTAEAVLAARDAEGVSVAEALAAVNAALPPLPVRPAGFPVAGYLELHIEQGPVLERTGTVIGAVTGIQGKQTWRITVTGEEGHAGTQPMAERRDALMGAAAAILALRAACAEADPDVMLTVGRLVVEPNAPSVVPGRVTFTIDLRHPDTALMRSLGRRIPEICADRAAPCTVEAVPLIDAASVVFDEGLRRRTLELADRLGHPAMELPSLAGHDARPLASVAPAAMIFVPCRAGISHNEAEWAEPAHLAAGTRVLAALLAELSEG